MYSRRKCTINKICGYFFKIYIKQFVACLHTKMERNLIPIQICLGRHRCALKANGRKKNLTMLVNKSQHNRARFRSTRLVFTSNSGLINYFIVLLLSYHSWERNGDAHRRSRRQSANLPDPLVILQSTSCRNKK